MTQERTVRWLKHEQPVKHTGMFSWLFGTKTARSF